MNTMVKGAKTGSLLRNLCGEDDMLYSVLANTLYQDPTKAVSEQDLDTLIEEAEKTKMYGFALDKAIFEGAQNPDERERYISVIRDLVSKSVAEMEKEKEAAKKEGTSYLVSSLEEKIERQKLLDERAGDVIDVASKFYEEKLADLNAKTRHQEREREMAAAEREDRKINQQEKAAREERKKERKKMGRKERKEAEVRDREKRLAAEARKEERAEERRAAAREAKRMSEQEKSEKESRREERSKE